MDVLAKLLALSPAEKEARGLVYTPREIFQQPETWRQSYQKVVLLARSLEEFLDRAGLSNDSKPLDVRLVGAGTSDYIGKSVSALLQQKWRCDVQSIPSTDLLTNIDEYVVPGRSYLWISFSRSGDSSEGVAVLETALQRYPEIHHLVITCNKNGQMARSFQNRPNLFSIVLDDTVNDRGLAMTSSFSNMVVVAQSLAYLPNIDQYGKVVDELSAAASKALPHVAEVCESLVRDGFSRVCFLGSGPLKGAATEAALKVLELTDGKIFGFSESFLGLRHGPLSAIDRDTLVVNFISGNERRRAFELDLMQEICEKALTAKCLVVVPRDLTETIGCKLIKAPISWSFSEQISDLHRPPVDVLIGQLLGLFASLREGLKPDSPSPQGAINRVVTHVTIH